MDELFIEDLQELTRDVLARSPGGLPMYYKCQKTVSILRREDSIKGEEYSLPVLGYVPVLKIMRCALILE